MAIRFCFPSRSLSQIGTVEHDALKRVQNGAPHWIGMLLAQLSALGAHPLHMPREIGNAREPLRLASGTRDATCPLDGVGNAQRGTTFDATLGRPHERRRASS